MKYNKYIGLIHRYLQGNLNPSEEMELQEWIDSDAQNLDQFKEEIKFWNSLGNYSKEEFDSNQAFNNFRTEIDEIQSKSKSPFKDFRHWMKYAAIFILLISVSLMFYVSNGENDKITTTPIENYDNEILLILNNGDTKVLSESSELTIENDKGEIIGKKEGRELNYNQNSNETNSKDNIAFNKILVPKGKVFELTLSDGTHVWLNAGTIFKYPQSFSSDASNRTVHLEGEAFFDVTENKAKPFVVDAQGVNVEVLGTKFNVSAYEGDKFINTVLVEGSVKVNDAVDQSKSSIIKPNQLSSFEKSDGTMKIENVDVNSHIAWISNKLIFENERFEDIVKKIERSYGVEIANFKDSLYDIRFYGEFDIENVDDVFKTFSASYPFEYIIKDSRVIIKN